MKLSFLLPFILFSSYVFSAENFLLYFGGGGEPKNKSTTIFDHSIPMLSSFTKNKSYKAEYYFTHQHKTSLGIATQAIGSNPKEFTKENWNSKLNQLIKDIESGVISKNSKIILALDTHGSDSEGVFKLSSVNGSVAPEEVLKKLIQKAESQGIKIGIIATNCTSGNLLKLASANTCILASSVPGQLGYTSEQAFFKNISTEKNLEEVFLKTREENGKWGLPSQPVISTPAGLETQEALKVLFPYLSEKEVNSPGSLELCHHNLASIEGIRNQFRPLISPTNQLGFTIDFRRDDISALKNAVSAYQESVQIYQKSLTQLAQGNVRCFDTPTPFLHLNGMGMQFSSSLNISMGMQSPSEIGQEYVRPKDYNKSCISSIPQADLQIQYHEEQLRNAISTQSSPELQEKLKSTIQNLRELKKDPIIQNAIKEKNENTSLMNSSLSTILSSRKQIAQLERQIYSQLYKDYSHKMKTEKNACKEFTL